MTTKIPRVFVLASLCARQNTKKQTIFSWKAAIFIGLFFASAFGANATVNDFNSHNSNNWNDDGNWSQGHVPTSGEDAEILNGATVTLDATVTVNKFFIGNGSTINFSSHNMTVIGDCTIGNGSGTSTLNLAGNALTVGGNIGGNGSGHLNTSGGGTVTCSGSFFPNNFDIGSGNGAGKLILNGTSGGFDAYVFHDLEISGNYTMGGSGSGTITGTFTVDAGKEFNPGGSSNVLNGNATAVFAGTGTIDVTNTTASSDNFGLQYHNFGNYDGDQALTIQFNGNAVQQINSSIFGAVIINNSHGVNLEGSTEFHGTLTLTSGNFYVDDNIIINLFDDLSIGGGSLSFSSNGTYLMVFDKGSASALSLPGGYTIGHLYVNRATGISLAGDLTINSSLVFLTGPLNIGAHTLTLNGDLNYTAGSISASSSSSIIVGDGAGADALELYGISNIGSLVVNRVNGVNLHSDFTGTLVQLNAGTMNLYNSMACTGDITGSSGHIIAQGDVTINLSGNLTVGSVFENGYQLSIFMNGSGAQTIGSSAYTCYDLTIGASSSTTIASDLTVLHQLTGNGALELGAHTLTVSGDFTVKNFTGDASSTVVLGEYNDNVSLGSGTGTYAFNNLTVNLSDGLTAYMQQNFDLNGKLTITRGSLNENGNAVNYGASSNVTFNSSSGSQTTTDATWPGSNAPATVTIDNPSGVILHNDRTVTNLVFTSGTIQLNDHNLTIADGGSITGYGSSKYVFTNNTGRLVMKATTGGTVFPIGDGYNPITVTPQTTGGYVSVGVTNGIKDAAGSAVTSHALNVEWNVVQLTGVTQNVGIQVGWTAGDELSGFDRTSSYISYRANSNTTGNYTHSAATDGSSFTQSTIISSMPSATQYYLGVSDVVGPLPVLLMSFNAVHQDNHVNLDWKTASEQNNDYFNIERSTDAISWTTIGQVKGNGTTNEMNNYSAIDNLAGIIPAGTFYYRLKQVDFNGKSMYSMVKAVNFSGASATFNAYPNPAAKTLNVNWTSPANEATTVRLINMNGVNVYQQVITGKGAMTQQVDVSALPAGIYYLQLSGNSGTNSQVVYKN